MKINNIYKNFKLKEKIRSTEIDSEIFVFEHVVLKTKLIFIKNSDKEKAFALSFKTPSPDSKGYQHILEHSVLRASEKYDFGNKEVFTDVLKKSSLTFLNAETYDDKTMYPFSTMLESEFFKVMDIYTDAALNPLCIKNKNYFKQEGWRWDKDSEGKYFINGVVFNEMKGRLSSTEVLAESKLMENIFPDTEYRFNAGGDPDKIPDLKYEEFVNYHKKYYHPSNATFLVYGDLDILKVMKRIDEDFLVNFKKEKKAEKSIIQKKFKKEVRKNYFFPSENLKKNSLMSITFLANENKDIRESFVNNFLTSILTDKNSGVYKDIFGSELVSDFDGEFYCGNLQSIFSFSFQGLEKKDFKKVEKIFFDSLGKIVKEKINKKILYSRLNKYQYSIFSKNFSNGRGLKVIGNILTQNLHEHDFSKNFEFKKNILFLKKEIKSGNMEKRIKRFLLKNKHKTVLTFSPKKDFDPYKKLTKKIEKINLLKENKKIREIEKEILEFKKYQGQKPPEGFEDLIKVVNKNSFPKKVKKSEVVVSKKEDILNYFQKIKTKEIGVYSFLFNGNFVDKDDLQYLKFLSEILPELAPEKKKREDFLEDLSKDVNSFSTNLEVFEDSREKIKLKFVLNLSFLKTREEEVFLKVSQLLENICFDKKIILQSIEKEKSFFKSSLAFNGGPYVSQRANSKVSNKFFASEMINGFEYYFFLKKLKDEVEKDFDKFEKKMKEISSKVFVENNIIVFVNSQKKDEKIYKKLNLKNKDLKEKDFIFKTEKINEGIVFEELENSFNAISAVVENKKDIHKISSLSNFLSYGFLWEKVREEGGAYGCRFTVSQSEGIFNIYSHMDSRVLGTLKDYQKVGSYLKNKTFLDSEIEGIISDTLSKNIEPVNIFSQNFLQFRKDILKIDLKKENKILEEKKSLTKKDIKNLSEGIEKAIKNSVKVSLGSSKNILKDKKTFDKIIYID